MSCIIKFYAIHHVFEHNHVHESNFSLLCTFFGPVCLIYESELIRFILFAVYFIKSSFRNECELGKNVTVPNIQKKRRATSHTNNGWDNDDFSSVICMAQVFSCSLHTSHFGEHVYISVREHTPIVERNKCNSIGNISKRRERKRKKNRKTTNIHSNCHLDNASSILPYFNWKWIMREVQRKEAP